MRVALVWHLHQPYYGSPGRKRFELPWVRLHAAKSYLDMAAVLEANPAVSCVANFSGALLEQLGRYVDDGWRDAYWDLSSRSATELEPEERRFVVQRFFSLAHDTVLRRHPRYVELLAKQQRGEERFDNADLTDLQVLFNLGWCGFTLRDRIPELARIEAKRRGFDAADKAAVLEAHLHALGAIVPAWRALQERGQVEVTVTPHYHPIMPLLCDTESARPGLPDAELPGPFSYPEDARAQLRRALDTAERLFGRRPVGVWPSEGSVSEAVVRLAADEGVRWMASDEEVLGRSDRAEARGNHPHLTPWRLALDGDPVGPALFFRDRLLSDLIGFRYARSPAEQAAADFVERLAGLLGEDSEAIATVILDGENAWEHYPDDGREFLQAFYEAIAAANVTSVLPRDVIDSSAPVGRLTRLHPGSWIDANFRIWIGSPVKNRAWELLRATRDAVAAADPQDGDEAAAWRYLSRAEGSDWMWWFGDDFDAREKDLFDRLFRENLVAAYRAMRLAVPDELAWPVARPEDDGEGDVSGFRPAVTAVSPPMDGRAGRALAWMGAATLRADGAAGSMYDGSERVALARLGFDEERVYVRLEPRDEGFGVQGEWIVRVRLGDALVTWTIDGSAVKASVGAGVLDWAIDWSAPLWELDLQPGESVACVVEVEAGGISYDRLPREGAVWLDVPDDGFAARHWLV